MHNGDANFKTLTPRILNLEKILREMILFHTCLTAQVCKICMYIMYIMYVQYVQYVCTLPMATHSSTIECANHLFSVALKTYS